MPDKSFIQNDVNPGISRPSPVATTLQTVAAGAGIRQIRGIDGGGATGAGIPKHVTNVLASVSPASVGSTSKVSVTFRRDPTDTNYSGAHVWVKGYQGNNTPVRMATGSESPATFILDNTGEPVSITVQASGNAGGAPLSTAPTVGANLPKSNLSGYGTSTVNTYTPSNPPPTGSVNASFMLGPGGFTYNGVSPTSGAAFVDSALRVYVALFESPFALNFSKATTAASSGNGAGDDMAFALYSTAGNLLWTSPTFHCPNSSNVVITKSLTGFSFNAGSYYLAWTATSASGGLNFWGWDTSLLGGSGVAVLNAGTQIIHAYSPNAATESGGVGGTIVMPATLGVLVTTGTSTTPVVLFTE